MRILYLHQFDLDLALSRVLFMTRSRLWPALVIPALSVVLALSLTRNATSSVIGGWQTLVLLLAIVQSAEAGDVREPFIDAAVERLGAPLTLAYVRLNILARV